VKDLKIVQVNTVCKSGSVGRIVVDLYKMTKEAGAVSFVAYGRNKAPEGIEGFKIGNQADFYCHVLRNFFRGESGFGSKKVTLRFIEWLKKQKPDVIHLHNIHGFYLQTELLFAYLKEADCKVIWTFHDCWPFTGHCAYFDYACCDKWKEGCHSCAQHRTAYPYAIFKDNSVRSYIAKKQAFTGVKNLTIVTPSEWLADLVKQSFLKEYPVCVIPNGIDLAQFQPVEENETGELSAQALQNEGARILPEKKVLLGVANVWENRKGLPYFERLAKELPSEYQIVLVGVSAKQKNALIKAFPSERLLPVTRTENVRQLAALYTRADLYVNATLEDNFPTTNLEALACGTPVLTFDTGGSKESLTTDCGKAVKKGDFEALKKACIDMTAIEKPVEACLMRAKEFDKDIRFREYLELYRG